MPRAPEHPDACRYYHHLRATWGYAGGSPPEEWCSNLRNRDGDCREEDCPYAKEGLEPETQYDSYADACERRAEAIREGD